MEDEFLEILDDYEQVINVILSNQDFQTQLKKSIQLIKNIKSKFK